MSTKVSVMVAACLLASAFVGGVLVGRGVSAKPTAVAMTSVQTVQNAEAKEELAACQEELAAHSMPEVRASAVEAVTDEVKRAAAEEDAQVEVLEKELRQCRKSDILSNADMCRAGNRYFYLLLAGLHADKACVDRFGMGDLILKHTEQCANFEDQTDPKEMDIGGSFGS